jgi:uncharacterized membrane protein YkgB
MANKHGSFLRADRTITGWTIDNGIPILRIIIGIIYVWLGVLKFFEVVSPA